MKRDPVTVRIFRNSPQRVIALLLCVLFSTAYSYAQQGKPTEYQVEAAYLYNFARFIEWPAIVAGQDDEFSICVIGQDPFGPALDSILAGKLLNGKPVTAKRISKPQEATHCRILFIDATEEKRLEEILGGLNQMPVLTVSNIPDFSMRGGMIQFVLEDNRVRFSVNLLHAERAGLTLSSELLKVAVNVTRAIGPGE